MGVKKTILSLRFHASQLRVCLTGVQSIFAHDVNISYYWGYGELV